jgi:C-terminal processing protease CtpA/Prc
MSKFLWIKKSAMLAVLIESTLFATYPVLAQDPDKEAVGNTIVTGQVQSLGKIYANTINNGTPADLVSQSLLAIMGPADDLLGATLQPVGDTLRAQLGLPAGQGLVVEVLNGDGACALAGLKQNDVLLSLADKQLATADDLKKQLKEAGDSAVPLKLMRAGKPMTIQVRPIYRVTLGPVGEQKTERYLGISVVGPNDATRAQLGLTDGKGMVVNEVEKGSPAERGGIKKYDIVLELDGKPIDSAETLQRQVQAAQDQTILKILHEGKPVTISILTGTRKVEANLNADAYRLFLPNRSVPLNATIYRYANVDQPLVDANQLFRLPVQTGQPADANDVRQRLDQLEKELAAVRAALDKINETLKAKK